MSLCNVIFDIFKYIFYKSTLFVGNYFKNILNILIKPHLH